MITGNVKTFQFTVTDSDNLLVEGNIALACVEVDVAVKRVSVI